MLEKRLPTARAVIIGDGPERARLARLAEGHGLKDQVEFSGRVDPVWPALERLDVYVTTSEYEGIPISVLEAMAAGLPVVATAVGGLPEVVEEGVTGFLVKRERDRAATAESLAARMAQLLLDCGLRRRMGEGGRSRVEQFFSSRAAGWKMLSVYTRELAGRTGGRRRG
jgi:glycosyltransferase involved in cell wall biosynthesis